MDLERAGARAVGLFLVKLKAPSMTKQCVVFALVGANQRVLLTKACLTLLLLLSVISCSAVGSLDTDDSRRLQETVSLVAQVKAFGKTLGIEPTEALNRTSHEAPALSLMWLWLQRAGTLALRRPIDIHMAIGFSMEHEQLKLEQVYRVDGYSVYHRRGNEFADSRSLTTIGFADEAIVRRVKVIFHEDLHGDKNFVLPWDIEESIVTPLGSLAAVEFFKAKGDEENLGRALLSLGQERQFSRELNELMNQAERIFATEAAEEANKKVLALLPTFPNYHRQFKRQILGQHPSTVLEAKLSHDFAYYRLHEKILSLHERAGGLKRLIEELKKLPRDTTHDSLDKYLEDLGVRYNAPSLN
jgi:predicted SprT family Zn-dependent metalloprotease